MKNINFKNLSIEDLVELNQKIDRRIEKLRVKIAEKQESKSFFDFSSFMKNMQYVILIISVCALTYANSLTNKFTSEDYHLILNNEFIPYWENVKNLFGRERLRPIPITSGARPLSLFSLMIDYRVWKYNPFGYHLTNVVLHTLVCLLVFVLFRLLRAGPDFSFITAVIYAVHPVGGEVVNVAGFRGDLIGAMFFLTGIIFFVKMVEKKQYFYVIPLFLSYLLAMLAKEVCIVLPLVLLLYLFVFKLIKKGLVIAVCLPMILFGGAYFLFFWLARYNYYIFRIIFINLTGPIKPYSSVMAYLNTVLITFFYYIKNSFLPFALSYDYQLTIPKFFSFSSLMGLLFLFTAVYGLIKIKDRILKFSLGLFLITYLPVSNLVPLVNTVADRYLYIPMIGFSFVLLNVFRIVFENIEKKTIQTVKVKKIFTVEISSLLTILFLGLCIGISFNRNYIFKDMFSLYKNTVKKSPANVRVRYNLAVAYRQKGRWALSNEQLEKVMSLNKQYKTDDVWQMMGKNYQRLGNNNEAKRYYARVLLLYPKKGAMNNLADILLREGNKKSSLVLWKKVLESYPEDKTALAGLDLIKNMDNK